MKIYKFYVKHGVPMSLVCETVYNRNLCLMEDELPEYTLPRDLAIERKEVFRKGVHINLCDTVQWSYSNYIKNYICLDLEWLDIIELESIYDYYDMYLKWCREFGFAPVDDLLEVLMKSKFFNDTNSAIMFIENDINDETEYSFTDYEQLARGRIFD